MHVLSNSGPWTFISGVAGFRKHLTQVHKLLSDVPESACLPERIAIVGQSGNAEFGSIARASQDESGYYSRDIARCLVQEKLR